MKKLVFHGLAFALGLVMVSPIAAQDAQNIWHETGSKEPGAFETTPLPIRSEYTLQEQESPSDSVTPSPIAGDNIAPVEGQGGDDCGLGGSVSRILGCGRQANWVAGIYGIGFSRVNDDVYPLAYNATPTYATTSDIDQDFAGGVEAMIGQRNCTGRGWEMRYWGLYPSQADVQIVDGRTNLIGLQWLTDPTSGNAISDIFNIINVGDDHRIYQNSEFHNVEFNFLCNAGCCCNRSYEWLSGFRWIEFDEDFRYRVNTTFGANPPWVDYEIDTSNTLLGYQLGGRQEWCLCKGVRMHLGVKGGVFNNYIRHRQVIRNDAGVFAQINAGPFAGTDYNITSSKNDFAMMGELDLGMSYQFGNCWRFRGGYRAVGFSGVALTGEQFPYNFRDVAQIRRINSNGSLILHGFYAGAEFCF